MSVKNDLAERQFKNAYLLYGDEAFMRNNYKNQLKAALADPSDTLNYAYFEGKGINPDDVAGLVETLPFMAEYRLIIVENSDWFGAKGGASEDGGEAEDEGVSSGKLARLTEAIKNIDPSVVIVFCEPKADKRSKLYKTVQSKGAVEEFAQFESAETVGRWIAGSVNANGYQIAAQTCMYMVEELGKDLTNLSNELEKLYGYCYESKKITVDDVDMVCTHQISTKIFDMISAMAVQNRELALEKYFDLIALREAPFHILALIIRQYNQMLQVKDGMAKNNNNVNATASALGMQNWMVQKTNVAASKMTRRQIIACLEACAKADEAIKSGNLTDSISIELLIVECSNAMKKD